MSTPMPWSGRLERVQEMAQEAREAAARGDWETAINLADQAAKMADLAVVDVVNRARIEGRLTDEEIGRIRRTSRSAVQQRFGSRQAILREVWPKRDQQD